MDRFNQGSRPGATGIVMRAAAWCVSAVAWVVATVIGGIVAVVLAFGMVFMAVMATLLIVLGVTAIKARRSVRSPNDPTLIEAHNVSGHSWVAYGWDGSH